MSAAQVLRQAEALKAAAGDVAKGNPDAWVSRQTLQDMYQRLLIMDLEYALDKKVEQDLWNHAFKNQITSFQNQVKDKGNPKRGEMQATLGLFLDMASGFYLQLLQELCSAFKLDLPMRKRSHSYGILKDIQTGYTRMRMPKKSSSLYICQYCLVHLGDIARYRQQVEQAQTYYRHAACVVPYNGQPYNQLAILEAAKGNKLSTVFYYIRSIAVKHPFPVASTNLEKFYAKISKDNNEYKNKLSMNEIISGFLQFHALLHHCAELGKAKILSDRICQGFNTHIPSSFSAYQLLQMTAINLFALHHAKRKLDIGDKEEERSNNIEQRNNKEMNGDINIDEELSTDEKKSFNLIFELLLHMLDVMLQSAPKHESKLKDHHTLPSLKIILDWLCSDPETLQHTFISKYTGIWPNLAKNLNNLQFTQQDQVQTNGKKYARMPLPEDRDLHCFVPLAKSHMQLNFHNLSLEGVSEPLESHLRRQRLTEHGLWIAEEFPSMSVLNVHKFKSGRLEFTSAAPQVKLVPGESDSILETRGGRQNVAIQAIMQNRAKQNISPGSMGGKDILEKSKSEPVMVINQPDIVAQMMAEHSETMQKKQTVETNTATTLMFTGNTTPASISGVESGNILERKPKMGAIWDSSSETAMNNSKENRIFHNKQNMGGSHKPFIQNTNESGHNGDNAIKTNDPWLNTSPGGGKPHNQKQQLQENTTKLIKKETSTEPKYFFGEPKTSTEMESIRAGPSIQQQQHQQVHGSTPFGLSAFGPLVFKQEKANSQQQQHHQTVGSNNNNLQNTEPEYQSVSAHTMARNGGAQFGVVKRPMGGGMVSQEMATMPPQQRMLVNPGKAYPGVGLGPQLPFSSWGIGGNRAPPLMHQQGMRTTGGPWNPQLQPPTRPVPWGNIQAVGQMGPQQAETASWGLQGSQNASINLSEQTDAHGGIIANPTMRPIGPSPSQLPLPNFNKGGPTGGISQQHSMQPPWEARQEVGDIHPTLRQLFQSAQGSINVPTKTNPVSNSPGAKLEEQINRARYPSSSDQQGVPMFVAGMDMRRLSEDQGMSPFSVANDSYVPSSFPRSSNMDLGFSYMSEDIPKPDSPPKIDSPGMGSIFSTTPENAYNSPTSGTYSLFNSQSPWSLPINKQDAQSHSSSPFGSSTASNRTSPDHFTDERSPNLTQVINVGYGLVTSEQGTWPVNPQQSIGNSQPVQVQTNPSNMLSNNLQSLWSGPSALERLLEAQRQQKGDPH